MMVRLLVVSAGALAVAVPAAHSVARDFSPATSRRTFKTTAELVTVPLTVTSRNGTAQIDGLTPEDFRLFEDGVAQTVTLLDRERRPLSLCIVLDSSNSMKGNKQRLATVAVQQVLAVFDPRTKCRSWCSPTSPS